MSLRDPGALTGVEAISITNDNSVTLKIDPSFSFIRAQVPVYQALRLKVLNRSRYHLDIEQMFVYIMVGVLPEMFSIGLLPRDTRHEISELFRFVFFRNNSTKYWSRFVLFFLDENYSCRFELFKKTTRPGTSN